MVLGPSRTKINHEKPNLKYFKNKGSKEVSLIILNQTPPALRDDLPRLNILIRRQEKFKNKLDNLKST